MARTVRRLRRRGAQRGVVRLRRSRLPQRRGRLRCACWAVDEIMGIARKAKREDGRRGEKGSKEYKTRRK